MNLTVNIQAEDFLARLKGSQDRLSNEMQRVVTRLSIEVQAAVKDKLTGGVLHVRTGTLRRSINRVVNVDGSNVEAIIGTNVRYAGVHEFGFDGNVTVKAHTRTVTESSKVAMKKLGKSKAPTATVNVREHSRHMTMPERSFLRSTLKDFTPRIERELRAAALRAVV